MVIHSSLATASAAAHVQDMLAEAERYRTHRTSPRSWLRRIVRGRLEQPDPPAAISDANRR